MAPRIEAGGATAIAICANEDVEQVRAAGVKIRVIRIRPPTRLEAKAAVEDGLDLEEMMGSLDEVSLFLLETRKSFFAGGGASFFCFLPFLPFPPLALPLLALSLTERQKCSQVWPKSSTQSFRSKSKSTWPWGACRSIIESLRQVGLALGSGERRLRVRFRSRGQVGAVERRWAAVQGYLAVKEAAVGRGAVGRINWH